jgi:hypothetical protein
MESSEKLKEDWFCEDLTLQTALFLYARQLLHGAY